MFRLKNYKWKSKYNYISLILVTLALLNLRIIIKDEIINSRIFSVLLTNTSWYFLSILLLLVLRIRSFYKLLFTNNRIHISESAFESYKIIGLKIIGGILELVLVTVLLIFAIAINLQLMNSNFIKQSIDVLQLSGINPSREIPLVFIILMLSYCLLLVTIYLSMVIVKLKFSNISFKSFLSFLFFINISLINIFIIYGMFKNIVVYTFITIIALIIKTVFLMILWYLMAGLLLEESDFFNKKIP